MSPSPNSPFIRRLVRALALTTLAIWALMLTAIVECAPGRALAREVFQRLADRVASTPDAALHVPAAAAGGFATCDTGSGYAYGYSSDDSDGFSWAVLDENDEMTGESMNTSIRRYAVRRGEPFFWFREDGDEFIVRDRALVAQARAAVEPMKEIGQEMGKVGGEMGRHGARMGRIGGKMGAVGARMGALQTRLALSEGSAASRARLRAELEEMRGEMDRLRVEMDASRDVDQEPLRQRMAELSVRQKAALREARTKLREIAARARREGKAERPHANA